ncbi:flavin reductase family protein [Engelhardtia mirabilis]|uniref:Diflavin flavoprotein A 1 n=1 Tax=Engelhardtia mirabilis TaxID=2528011 RepID=A0A518BT05_9BACT|nr:Diflavin flavoprotein A 1 [Planctomycetes bacterium Pla133]QDV04426.1 Diflavin flavoprotein A 1 [Planctomycetes bacterium Pla86]
MASADISPLARALGRIPSGLFIVSTLDADGLPLGFLGSFVQQVGFDPPTVAVAVGVDRDHLQAMRDCGRFAVSILDQDSKGAMKPFFGKLVEGATPFDDLATSTPAGGPPVLGEALAWVTCEVTGEQLAGDHVLVLGRVLEGIQVREGDPLVHLRKNGLSY